ncbi:class I SAM-dependent methyltransferase [Nitrospirillum sp. BR 11828]|uniref:class I SAM-dependent methyltransferase n=1 Tax=Nitrospirillum sp. BR 11828 TaxID=3104325 RepID=UPI002ACA5971|nr:methyltransferase domain-containing protein [Nitrospirillum sp. BR 11828]MDZ5650067.1 methyltransferase domain-containing protein [Nitrospirillum sp. BR 11828]
MDAPAPPGAIHRFHPWWHGLGRQLRHPTGLWGHLLGRLMNRVNAAPNRAAISALAPRPGDTLLELGFGPGHGLALAVSAVGTAGMVHGVDQSAVMLRQAGRLNRQALAAGRLHLHLGRFDALPLAAASVDGILAVNVAYFWREPARVLGEVRRVLRPGGRLVVYVTDAATMRRWPFALTGTHRLFTAIDLMDMLVEGGFPANGVSVAPLSLGHGMTGLIAIAATLGPFSPAVMEPHR